MKKVIITGISGTLGQALGKEYLQRGWEVIGVSRRNTLDGDYFSRLITSNQQNEENASKLLDVEPDLIILNAGQIETEIGSAGEPLIELVDSLVSINYYWPSIVALKAAELSLKKNLDIIAIGSIADGSPSCFGPVYHATKIALHYFWTGVGPIVYHKSNKKIRMRLYRPGAIKGPLAWAPVNRLNEKGYKIREKRVNSTPDAEKVARHIANWIEKGKQWIGTYDEPFSFRLLKLIHTLMPNLYYKIQLLAWKKGSKFVK